MTTPEKERRSRNRVASEVPISITSDRREIGSARARDLSLSGIFFYTSHEIREGNDLEMVLMLPPELTQGEKKWVCCQASVIRVESKGDSQELGVAASIRNIATLPELPT